MAVPMSRGVTGAGVRGPIPDWAPFGPPRAPGGAPDVIAIGADLAREPGVPPGRG